MRSTQIIPKDQIKLSFELSETGKSAICNVQDHRCVELDELDIPQSLDSRRSEKLGDYAKRRTQKLSDLHFRTLNDLHRNLKEHNSVNLYLSCINNYTHGKQKVYKIICKGIFFPVFIDIKYLMDCGNHGLLLKIYDKYFDRSGPWIPIPIWKDNIFVRTFKVWLAIRKYKRKNK